MLAALRRFRDGYHRPPADSFGPRTGLRRSVGALLDLWFPPRCAWCRGDVTLAQGGVLICTSCRAQFVGANAPRCARCGQAATAELDASATSSCAACRGIRLRFDAVIALGDHRDPLRQTVLRMKQPHEEALSLAMGELLFSQREEQLAAQKANVVIPIPMHWSRRMWRGANAPELLATSLARRLHVPLARRALVRRRNTRQQGSLLRSQRRANIRGAFRLAAGYDFSGASVLLVDDVMTTGATCSEAAGVLRRAGAARIAAAVVARAGSV